LKLPHIFPSYTPFSLALLPQADVDMDGASNAGSDGERRMAEGHASQHVDEEGSRERLFTAREVEQIVQEAVGRREEELTQLFQKTLQEQLTGESVWWRERREGVIFALLAFHRSTPSFSQRRTIQPVFQVQRGLFAQADGGVYV
jgi:1,6-anhydro-N-acetylmuramate kinase